MIGRITPNGQVKEFAVRHPLGEITPGPHHEMLFTQMSINKIGRITLSGKVSEIPIPPTAHRVARRTRKDASSAHHVT